MAAAIQFILNGRPVRIDRCSPNTTLLEFLRDAGLTGAKEGCAEGDCGACSVVMVDRDVQGRPCYRAINSCLVPVCLMAGREIISVEGVAHSALRTPHSALAGGLHPVQQKMAEGHGSQCGYCTPGFIMSLFEGYYRGDIHRQDELDDQLCGNLCRCTGYRPIRDAAMQAFFLRSSRGDEAQNKWARKLEPPHVGCYKDLFTKRLKRAGASLNAVEYAFGNEKFFRPDSLPRLLRLRKRFPDARLIAGATELGLDITKRFKTFPVLISVEAVPELREIKATPTEWRIGAAATLTRIEEKMAREYPALRDMLRVFGSRLIRNRATMGGNIVTASPIGDSAPVLLALDATVVLASRAGERALAIEKFFVAYRKTALRADEILKTIIVPRGVSQAGLTRRCSWFKVSKRREMDISTVAACFTVDLDRQKVVRHVRLAYGGVAVMPARARKTESALLGKVWNDRTIAGALPILRTEFAPISDFRGSADYRGGLVTALLEKFYFDSIAADVSRLRSPLKSQSGLTSAATKTVPHESAHKHVTGEAIYTDDQIAGRQVLQVWPVCAPHARARILERDATAARRMPGIKAVLLAEDVPGLNDVGAVKHDEILLADREVFFHGQIVALVVGETLEACRAAAAKVAVRYKPLRPLLTLNDAIASGSFHNEPNYIRRGDCEAALKRAPLTMQGRFEMGGQEHFYLETQAAWAERGEDGSMALVSSTQHPGEVQSIIARLLDVPANKVVVQSPRMGGGFGGKETQAAGPAALAALAAYHTGRPVRVRWNRDQDMTLTGHRHPFLARFKVGFDRKGRLLAAKIHLCANGGWSLDLSQAISDRALFHLDNGYYIPAAEFRGQVAKTNLASNTAFRGFGGPQGMVVMEEILDRIARRLGLAPEVVRERNLYHGRGETNTTPYGQEIGDNRLQSIWRELKRTSRLAQRRKEIARWNANNPHRKRGIAMTPVKFGISFTVSHLNQAGALVLIYQDGSVQVNHGGTEMGQGIHTNIKAIAARELGVNPERVRVMPTSTDKVPNTSATAASSGTDMNGAAAKNACDILRARLAPFALALVAAEATRLKLNAETQSLLTSAPTDNLVFADGFVFHRQLPKAKVPFAAVVQKAYLARVSLSATGYYATPGIDWDRAAGSGRPFYYFACGAAVTEVEVDGFTGMHRVRQVDILHDAGESINEGVNRGQIEGGFVQALGWLTTEELKWDEQGRLLTHSPDTYKIPSVGDGPQIFNVALLKDAAQKGVVGGSKAVGEPPFMLAISAREALREAVAAFAPGQREVPLPLPATGEAIWMAIRNRRKSRNKPVPRS
jgi:xanthine dehydrogenase molybdopterin binding subunit/xanthine dehydrogenase small subunit